MPYSEFDLPGACERFGLAAEYRSNLFAGAPDLAAPGHLREFLDEWMPIAFASGSEKARGEMIVAPILIEVVRLTGRRLKLFIGVALDVDKDRDLNGVCDYLLSLSAIQVYLDRPVVAVVEAKKDDILGGLGLCAAAMVGAREFNARGGRPASPPVCGAVTTGTAWRFLRLDGDALAVDRVEYALADLGKILGIPTSFAA